ncbi:IS110 family transposase [bacterium]|nr:IS110 family transposase [bacterium]
MYLVGIDIAKYNHQCSIATGAGEVINEFSFDNNLSGFNELLNALKSLDKAKKIKIGLEATGHYANTLKQFLSIKGYTFIEFNPYLAKQFFKSTTIRKTKTDKIDARLLSSMLASVDYKALHTKSYHINELKALTRARDSLITDRSNYLVQITNALDNVFPEFKSFFSNRLGQTPLYILNRYDSLEKISKITRKQYDKLHNLSRGRFTYNRLLQLKQLAKDSIGIKSKSYFSLIKRYISLINNLNKELDLIENDIYSIMSMVDTKLTTIPGVSLMSAAIIIGEIGDINRFSNSAKLTAYAGFDIAIYQSGEQEFYGRLVKRGSPLLRKTIWNLVFGAIRLIPQITDYYYKKRSEGKHHKIAYSAICRKLIRLIYFIESTNTTFDIKQYR